MYSDLHLYFICILCVIWAFIFQLLYSERTFWNQKIINYFKIWIGKELERNISQNTHGSLRVFGIQFFFNMCQYIVTMLSLNKGARPLWSPVVSWERLRTPAVLTYPHYRRHTEYSTQCLPGPEEENQMSLSITIHKLRWR